MLTFVPISRVFGCDAVEVLSLTRDAVFVDEFATRDAVFVDGFACLDVPSSQRLT